MNSRARRFEEEYQNSCADLCLSHHCLNTSSSLSFTLSLVSVTFTRYLMTDVDEKLIFPAELELGRGCYLTYDSASAGSLFENWVSEDGTPPERPLAFFAPKKAVPKFRFIQRGGKKEIIRDCALIKMDRHFTGWTHFVKLAREFDGDFVVLTQGVRVYLNKDGPVLRCKPGEVQTLGDAHAVAVVDKSNEMFDVKLMEKFSFVQKGHEIGASLLLI